MVTNSALIEIRGAAPTNGSGDVADGALGTLRWSGARAAYLSRVKRSVKRNDVRVTIHVDQLVIRGTLPIVVTPGEPLSGDTIVVRDGREPATVKRFRVVAVNAAATRPGSPVNSVRLDLDDEREV